MTVVGDACWPSIRRRAGNETSDTASVPLPLVGQPFEDAGGLTGASLTTAVGTDVAELEPSPFFAVTRTRSVLPESTVFSV